MKIISLKTLASPEVRYLNGVKIFGVSDCNFESKNGTIYIAITKRIKEEVLDGSYEVLIGPKLNPLLIKSNKPGLIVVMDLLEDKKMLDKNVTNIKELLSNGSIERIYITNQHLKSKDIFKVLKPCILKVKDKEDRILNPETETVEVSKISVSNIPSKKIDTKKVVIGALTITAVAAAIGIKLLKRKRK